MKNPKIVASVVVAVTVGAISPFGITRVTADENAHSIVINEIHYDEADKTVRGEFIELINAGSTAVDLGGWFFSEGIDFTFPADTSLAPAAILVVAEDPEVIAERFDGKAALGPWVGSLRNSGESIVLRDASGQKVDEVSYGLGFPWPTTGDEPSPSIELIHPSLDNDLGGSWRASGNVPATPEMQLIERESPSWRYWKGINLPSNDSEGLNWKDPDYNAGGWLTGQTPIGMGDDDDKTLLDDMQGNYQMVIAQHTFELPPGPAPSTVEIDLYFDDGVIALLNGNEVARESIDVSWTISTEIGTGVASSHEAEEYESVLVRGVQGYLREGTNVLTLVGLNSSIGGSDFSLDASLRSVQPSPDELITDPTPGKPNTVFSTNAPPLARQIDHQPESPKSDEPVTVSIKVTDPDGVKDVSLHYQVVNPGDYITKSDERYSSQWESLTMEKANDGDVFSAVIPGEVQTHRRLVRYRVLIADTTGNAVMIPYLDDPQPNFAYFVYDGIPEYTGSATTSSEPVTYSSELLDSLPTYHFITTRDNHETALHIPDARGSGYTGSDYRWEGTMVYDGKVYDHIRFRARGGVWRYAMGKNMWKFDFNRGHRFQARDDYGRKYKTKWDKLNFSACIQQGNFEHRGEQGLFESTGFQLFNLVGVEAPNTHYVHFRVIDDELEIGESQFETDFQGLYLAIEQMDGRFLEEHDLPDGNLYKIEGHSGTSNNQGPTQVSNRRDVRDFIRGYRNGTPQPEWWRENLDVPGALSYHTITEAIHHYDIAYGKNYFYYVNPETGKFKVLPWDLDLTWANNMYGNGQHDFLQKLCKRAPFNVDFQNRMREVMDLLYNSEQTGMLIDEKAAFVYQPGQASFVDIDRAMWDYNPILRSRNVNSSKAGHGRFYREADSRDFAGMIKLMKDYVVSRGRWMERTYLKNEDEIPNIPTINYSGTEGFPPDGLQFSSSAFASPENSAFAGMKWRIAEVTDPAAEGFDPYNRETRRNYEIDSIWESDVITDFTESISVPALEARPGRTYRARVRHLDEDGRWSHWSEPLQFVAGDPDISTFQQSLAIEELMYNPAPPTTEAELAVSDRNSDFEYLVVRNIGPNPLDLTNVRFTKGIDFDFAAGAILGSGERIFVVKNLAAFKARYGNAAETVVVAGEWDATDNLSDGGENVRLTYGAGAVIREFVYDDSDPWPESADGEGFSLMLADPSQIQDPTKSETWTASTKKHGSLGTEVVGESGFAAWKSQYGITDNNNDDDADGNSAIIEYVTHSNPLSPDPSPVTANLDASGQYLEITFQWNMGATDASYQFRISSDLNNWQMAESDRFKLVREQSTGQGVVARTYRDSQPLDSGSIFVQLHVVINP